MTIVRDQPLLTDLYEEPKDFAPENGSTYLSSSSVEERSEHLAAWRTKAKDVRFFIIEDDEGGQILARTDTGVLSAPLRSDAALATLVERFRADTIYIDFTGMRHHVWAPLVRASLKSRARVICVYVEPRDYRPSLTPTEGEIYDLSERINGIAPIPGFASLSSASPDEFCFVPLLGFEGTRVAYLLEQVQPAGEKVVPVVGVPGFRPEYPFLTYYGNRRALLDSGAWQNTRFAIANCPFSLFFTLQDIASEYEGQFLKIAPIGTKPHALGAVLYAIASPGSVELVYDHPIRKAQRTASVARLFAYHVSDFLG